MSEIQATIEFQVELTKFYNVDLFQRGFYQIRVALKMSQKTIANIEVRSTKNENKLVVPSCVVNNIALSKVFQILYRKEDIEINDVFLFKVDMLVDLLKIEENIIDADFQLCIELWFTEEDVTSTSQLDKLLCISQRILKLHFLPIKGIHHHVPLLFDYFHLSAISINIHASLIALQQPYVSLTRNQSSKSLKSGSATKVDQFSFESIIFGSSSSIASSSSSRNNIILKNRKSIACERHKLLCRILLSAYESIQHSYELLLTYVPSYKQVTLEHVDCYAKLEELFSRCRNFAGSPETEEDDLFQSIQTDLSTLCSQNVILWVQYLELVTLSTPITRQLAKEHHIRRVKRFSEGFFVNEYPKQEAIACFDNSLHGHSEIGNRVRNSEYYQSIPSLPVECVEIDGDYTTLPIIFEDIYSEPFVASASSFSRSDVVRRPKVYRNSYLSDNSSVSEDSLSPKMRRSSKPKFIKNVRPESFKRPSSYLNSSSVNGQVAFDQTDCTLVGYRKLDQKTALPTVELGTLNETTNTATLVGSALIHPCLYNAISMPTLFGQGHLAITNSGSLPELASTSAINTDSQFWTNSDRSLSKLNNDSSSNSSQELTLQSIPDSSREETISEHAIKSQIDSTDIYLEDSVNTMLMPFCEADLNLDDNSVKQEKDPMLPSNLENNLANVDTNNVPIISDVTYDIESVDITISVDSKLKLDDVKETNINYNSLSSEIRGMNFAVDVSDMIGEDYHETLSSLQNTTNLNDLQVVAVPGGCSGSLSGQCTMLELIKEEYEKNKIEEMKESQILNFSKKKKVPTATLR